MKFQTPLLVVTDLERSKQFYRNVLGLEVILDFGANVTLTGGIALQTQESWLNLIHRQETELAYGGNVAELYFEEDRFDEFLAKLGRVENLDWVHPAVEHSWGQRAVRFYDPDGHIIEVGENIVMVVRRFVAGGLSLEETAVRMDVPLDYVKSCVE